MKASLVQITKRIFFVPIKVWVLRSWTGDFIRETKRDGKSGLALVEEKHASFWFSPKRALYWGLRKKLHVFAVMKYYIHFSYFILNRVEYGSIDTLFVSRNEVKILRLLQQKIREEAFLRLQPYVFYVQFGDHYSLFPFRMLSFA